MREHRSSTASGTLSSHQVGADGALTPARAAATGAGSAPIDSALSCSSAFLHVDDSGPGSVQPFKARGANPAALGRVTGTPTDVQGVAAR